MRDKVSLDFETRSWIDLLLTGSWKYSRHHTTSVHCMSYCINGGTIKTWSRGDEFPEDLRAALDNNCTMHAWNAQFERHVWMNHCVTELGWPPVNDMAWRCTAAKSAHANHPRSLDRAADMCLPDQPGKDKAGATLMRKMSKPGKWTKKEREAGCTGLKWVEGPVEQALLELYCEQDVRVEMAMDEWLPEWPEDEIRVWQRNESINDLGTPFDYDLCVAASGMLNETLDELSIKISKMTEGEITTGNQIAKIKEFIQVRGVNTTSLDAAHVEALLETQISDEVRDILLLRQVTSGAAAKKFQSALDVMDEDSRGRGLFIYYGASATGRFISVKTQIQNMKKGTDPTDTFRNAVVAEDLDLLHVLYGNSIVTELGKNVRASVCAPKGHTLVRVDSSQIECRVLHWLAGNDAMLHLFANNLDPYCDFVSKVLNRTITKADYDERQLGKCAVLGLGFGMGAARFVAQAFAQYGLVINAKFAKKIVDLYRDENDVVVKFWHKLEHAAQICVQRRQPIRVGRLVFAMEGDYLVTILPSGRKLYYWKPAFVEGKRGPRFEFTGVRGRREEWAGGLLCENSVQAVARDTLVHYMGLTQDAGIDVVAHIHDELMTQVPLAKVEWAEKKILDCFATPLPWMKGLPCAAEATVGERYAG
jgi:DNA polymerase